MLNQIFDPLVQFPVFPILFWMFSQTPPPPGAQRETDRERPKSGPAQGSKNSFLFKYAKGHFC